jgi:uroporphyrinogen-III decarboxylase
MSMDRNYYLKLAASGLRMPIGTHLALHQQPDADAIPNDGLRLGKVVEAAAQEFQTPMAFPLMDLTLEKSALLSAQGVAAHELESFHFQEPPPLRGSASLTPRMAATCEAIRYIATQTQLLPVGMGIGPFSLTTKLLSDPITPVYLAGTGATPATDAEVRLLERVLELAEAVIHTYLEAQIRAGAKAVILCEPAANTVYFSPNQLARSYEIFDRYVLEPNQRVRQRLENAGVDLIFHDCGELVDGMIDRFVSLDPAILSLGSSRKLWQDAARVPKSTVLYGNLPTKHFYSDSMVSLADVQRLKRELVARMAEVRHPFILGSECDVLSVSGHERTIRDKVSEFMRLD